MCISPRVVRLMDGFTTTEMSHSRRKQSNYKHRGSVYKNTTSSFIDSFSFKSHNPWLAPGLLFYQSRQKGLRLGCTACTTVKSLPLLLVSITYSHLLLTIQYSVCLLPTMKHPVVRQEVPAVLRLSFSVYDPWAHSEGRKKAGGSIARWPMKERSRFVVKVKMLGFEKVQGKLP